MKRGTTPLHVFSVNRDLRGAKVYLTYRQGDDAIITKTNEDLDISETAVVVELTQSDTLLFKDSRPTEVQIRYVTDEGVAEASDIIKINVERILKDGVIEYE